MEEARCGYASSFRSAAATTAPIEEKEVSQRKTKVQDSCKRCGTCCQKGGPILHNEDRELLAAGHIGRENLITIRKGEQVYSPITGEVESAATEMIKLRGQKGEWTCIFYDEAEKTCRLYENRPLECRLLKCWDTKALEEVIGQRLLSRKDLVDEQDPLRRLIDIQERECSCATLAGLCEDLGKGRDEEILTQLTELVHRDFLLRLVALKELRVEERFEFFVLGRPLFKQLAPYGIKVFEEQGKVRLAL